MNAAGKVVGMITASERTAFEGTPSSFAIPVDRALAIVETIRSGRESSRVVAVRAPARADPPPGLVLTVGSRPAGRPHPSA